jgi:hypothetical protein
MHHRITGVATALVGLTLATGVVSAEEAKGWHIDTSLNLFLAGMSGDVTAKGIPASVDASFGDILEHVEASVAGRVTVGRDKWFVSTEFSYLRVGAEAPRARADMKQWLVEPSLGYAVSEYVSLFAGARYNNIDGEVRVIGGPGLVATGVQDWWDPIVGTQLRLPVYKDKLSLEARLDVGGFDVGSDLTWQAHPYLNWRMSRRTSMQLGYRWMGTDYETGSGFNKFRYDVIVEGAQLGLSLHF